MMWRGMTYFPPDNGLALSVLYVNVAVIATFFFNDTFNYWTYRALHHRWFYKSIHKKHHLLTRYCSVRNTPAGTIFTTHAQDEQPGYVSVLGLVHENEQKLQDLPEEDRTDIGFHPAPMLRRRHAWRVASRPRNRHANPQVSVLRAPATSRR
jgi:hypothetical protein